MTAPYTIKPKADVDIEEYAAYLADHSGLEMALRFLDCAADTFALLASHPQMGWRARVKHPELEQLRVFRVGQFSHMLMLYRPLPPKLEVLRVIHGSRNLRALLRREGF